jgi:hypothetical protein
LSGSKRGSIPLAEYGFFLTPYTPEKILDKKSLKIGIPPIYEKKIPEKF